MKKMKNKAGSQKKELTSKHSGVKKKLGIASAICAAAGSLAAGIAFSRRLEKRAEDDMDLWNDTAKLYDLKFTADRKSYKEIIALISGELNPHMRVLEIAAATGDIARGIAPECGIIVASDFSEKMINKAKQKGTPENVIWDLQDGACLTYPDESFDAVIIVNALNAVPYPDEILDEAKRVLKKEGVLIAPNYIRMGKTAENIRNRINGVMGYESYNVWTYEEYKEFFESNGWNIVREDLIPSSLPVAFIVASKK